MPERNDEFFVGYLPTPDGAQRFTRRTVFALAGLLLVAVGVIAALQRDPGPGRWHNESTATFTGVLRQHPYPALETPDRTYLLVDQGKHGAAGLTKGLDGMHVSVTGQLLDRDTLALIELHSPPTGVSDSAGWSLQRLPIQSERQTLQGEIIDPKCYAGAMKPGDGKAHKACATLCIKGGIPPMFRTDTPDGAATLYLLADSEGRPLTGETLDAVLPFVADKVQLSGTIERRGATLVLRLEPGSILRL